MERPPIPQGLCGKAFPKIMGGWGDEIELKIKMNNHWSSVNRSDVIRPIGLHPVRTVRTMRPNSPDAQSE